MIELAQTRALGGQVYAALLQTTKVVLDICKRKRRTIVLYVKNSLLTACTLSKLKKENNKKRVVFSDHFTSYRPIATQ